jgi:dihydropteroate synthase
VKLVARGLVFSFPRRPLVMGIVNLGADSFSGDGLPDITAALAHARRLVADGADIVDVGAESARTNRPPISEDDEAARLLGFIERWDESVPLAVNTWRPGVVRRVLPRGGHLLNDIGGLPTDENARVCADTGAALLIMHTVGQPKIAHTHVGYPDVLEELASFFSDKLALAAAAGLPQDATVLDPGLDFAKQRGDNLRIIRELPRLAHFGRPLLLPVSRKTVIGDVLGLPPADRDAGTVACLVAGLVRGAGIFRVHNVRAAAQAVSLLSAVGEPQ